MFLVLVPLGSTRPSWIASPRATSRSGDVDRESGLFMPSARGGAGVPVCHYFAVRVVLADPVIGCTLPHSASGTRPPARPPSAWRRRRVVAARSRARAAQPRSRPPARAHSLAPARPHTSFLNPSRAPADAGVLAADFAALLREGSRLPSAPTGFAESALDTDELELAVQSLASLPPLTGAIPM
jgi:hypothetical protein